MKIKFKKLLITLGLLIVSGNNVYPALSPAPSRKIKEEQQTFIEKLEKIEVIEDITDLISKATESSTNLYAFVNKIEEFVNEREDDDLESLRTVINYTLFNPDVAKTEYKEIQDRLKKLRTKASEPMTTTEKFQVLQRTISHPKKLAQFRDNPQDFLNKLAIFVAQRTDKTKEPLSDLLNTVKIRKVFLDKKQNEQLEELITIVPNPAGFYEKVVLLNLQLPKLSTTDVILSLQPLIKKFKKVKAEEKDKSEGKLTNIFNVMLYNPQFSVDQKKQAQEWLIQIAKEDIEPTKEPKKYTDRVLFYYNKSLNLDALKRDEIRTELLAGLSKLATEKMKGEAQDLQMLVSMLKFLKTLEIFTDLEKIQLDKFITDLEAEVSVSNIISKIYSLLSKAEKDLSTKNYIVELIKKAINNLIAQIKKDKKVPDENEMLKNLLSLYILESATYAANKTDIQKVEKELDVAIESIKVKKVEPKKEVAKPTKRKNRRR